MRKTSILVLAVLTAMACYFVGIDGSLRPAVLALRVAIDDTTLVTSTLVRRNRTPEAVYVLRGGPRSGSLLSPMERPALSSNSRFPIAVP